MYRYSVQTQAPDCSIQSAATAHQLSASVDSRGASSLLEALRRRREEKEKLKATASSTPKHSDSSRLTRETMPKASGDQVIEIDTLNSNAEASRTADDTNRADEAPPTVPAGWGKVSCDPKRRTVRVDAGQAISDEEYKLLGYADNSIRSYKYPWLLFVPMNLFEQFQRLANIYFLIIVIICFVPPLTPQTPLTSLMPLVMVLTIQAVKDAMEDLKRHRSDHLDNTAPAVVIRGGVELNIDRQDVRVGDVLQITQDPNSDVEGVYVAADCVLLATISVQEPDSASGIEANSKGICYINTKQLDGETNLKIFQAKPETAQYFTDLNKFAGLSCVLDCEGPGHENAGKLYEFSGLLKWKNYEMILAPPQLLLRGHVMEQTYKAWALVVNTGMQTKIQINLAGEKPYKVSSMEDMLNKQVILVFIMLGICVITCGIGLGVWLNEHGNEAWYIFVAPVNGINPEWDSMSKLFGVGVFDPDEAAVCGIYGVFTFIVVLSTFVPISLYVTIEMIKFVTGLLIDWDMNMFSEELAASLGGIDRDESGKWDQHTIKDMEAYKMAFAKCKSSKLVEQLGQVQYVLSDKTGTLTRNKMELCKMAICLEKPKSDGPVSQPKTEQDLLPHEYGLGLTDIAKVKAKMEEGIILEDVEKPDIAKIYERDLNKHCGGTFEFYDPRLNCIKDLDGNDVLPFLQQPNSKESLAIQDYMLALALCNTVVPEEKTVNDENGHQIERFIKYNASSPDDGALVKAAMNFGYELVKRKPEAQEKELIVLRIKSGGAGGMMQHREEQYLIHATFDANSDRKRMSVVAEGMFNGKKKIMVICKGADNIVRDRCACSLNTSQAPTENQRLNSWEEIFPERPGASTVEQDNAFMQSLVASAEKFAEQGLRCMVVAQAEITQATLDVFLKQYMEAKGSAAENAKAMISGLENRMEYNFSPLGVTAIEDKLQLNVGNCLRNLGKAGIQTWVLTGDKVDTAINIGYACNLLRQTDELRILIGKDKETNEELPVQHLLEQLDGFEKDYERVSGDGQKMSLVIDGDALLKFGIGLIIPLADESEIDRFHEMQEKLIFFAGKMASCVCCRVSPKQKGDITKLVKGILQQVCLGIGDGANDVEMILQGDVGVGVQGVEGSQAVNNSDFAITEFQHLENLLLVHGRWTYQRIATSVCYFFYKNIAFTMCTFWFAIYSAFSGQLFFEAWSASCYNAIFTVFPVLVFGLMNQDVSQEVARKCPKLYEPGQLHAHLNYGIFTWWVTEAVYASVIMFFFAYASVFNHVIADGRPYQHWTTSTTVYTACIYAVTLRIALETSFWTWITHLSYWGSIGLWFIYCFITCCWGVDGLGGYIPGYSYQYMVIVQIMQSGIFYTYCALVPFVVTLPAYLYRAVIVLYYPSLNDKCRNPVYWNELVVAGLMDPSLADGLTEEQLARLQKLEAGPALQRRGTTLAEASRMVPHESLNGAGDNTALWSGRKNLTGAEAIRRAARRALMEKLKGDKVNEKMGKFRAGRASGLSTSSEMLVQTVKRAQEEAPEEELRRSRNQSQATAAASGEDTSESPVADTRTNLQPIG